MIVRGTIDSLPCKLLPWLILSQMMTLSYTATSLVTVMKINTIFHAVSITVGTGPFIIGVRLINC